MQKESNYRTILLSFLRDNGFAVQAIESPGTGTGLADIKGTWNGRAVNIECKRVPTKFDTTKKSDHVDVPQRKGQFAELKMSANMGALSLFAIKHPIGWRFVIINRTTIKRKNLLLGADNLYCLVLSKTLIEWLKDK